ncbi:MAG TPA: hypothetical protein PLT03_07860 [Bacillota bacterium]|nr:hypothetical protein [Bacillota bacterium]HOA15859.1 hypothetical protein [Bacillota bacterium]HOG53773.1 hypothetical protein [Bacillota bacterium]
MKAKTAARIAIGVLVTSFALNMGTGSLGGFSLLLSFLLLALTIMTGIAFDIVGTAVAAATEPPINAVAARRIRGGAEALRLLRNAPQVANFCNDIVGDICGTLSGALAAASASGLAAITDVNPTLLLAVTVAVAATLTITFKYISKGFAISEAERVILLAGRVISYTNDLVPSFLKGSRKTGGRANGRAS